MKNFAKSLSSTFESKLIKKVKFAIIFVFVTLIILDIIFVMPNKFPTISQVVFDSSPKYLVIIWLFGLAITNIFFQKFTSSDINLKFNFLVILGITVILIGFGFAIDRPNNITCDNYQTEIVNTEIPYVTRILCQDYTNGRTERINRNCQSLKCSDSIEFKLDLAVHFKFLILISGIFAGYALWPSKLKKKYHT